MTSTRQLSEVLGEIYNKIHHLYAKKTPIRLLDWTVVRDDISIAEFDIGTSNAVTPAYWAPAYWASKLNLPDAFAWDEMWGLASWGAVISSLANPRYIYWGVDENYPSGVWYSFPMDTSNATLWGGHTMWGSALWTANELSNWI